MEIISELLIATGLSALIGLEREMRIQNGAKSGPGGLRTFAMLGPLGFLAVIIEEQLALHYFTIITFLIIFGFGFINYTYSCFREKHTGLTTEFSAIACFLTGVLVADKQILLAIAVSILFSLLLTFKIYLHDVAKNFKAEEFVAILKFLIITAVVLPILPDYTIDSWDIINPRTIWLMVVLVAGIRFVGFFISKVVGAKKGIVLTGTIGGFISSTAVTTSLSAQNKKSEKIVAPFLAGILIANAIMYVRVLLEAQVIYADIAKTLIIPLLTMSLVATIFGLLAIFTKSKDIKNKEDEEIISQPFSLSEGLKFGIFFLLILVASKIIPEYLGDSGLYVTSVVSGLVDTDAITLSVSKLTEQGEIAFKTGVNAITLAVMTNTVVKIGIISLFGGKKLKIYSIPALGIIILAGALALMTI